MGWTATYAVMLHLPKHHHHPHLTLITLGALHEWLPRTQTKKNNKKKSPYFSTTLFARNKHTMRRLFYERHPSCSPR